MACTDSGKNLSSQSERNESMLIIAETEREARSRNTAKSTKSTVDVSVSILMPGISSAGPRPRPFALGTGAIAGRT